jgi:nicotinamidase-related amidase
MRRRAGLHGADKMPSVEILDRNDLISRMLELLELDASDTAIVTVDMHRGHLDPEVATMPTTPETSTRVIAAAADVLRFARAKQIPIIHMVLTYRRIPGLGSEGMAAPFWAAISKITNEKNRLTLDRASTVDDHNIVGSRGTEIMPELLEETDYVIDNKKRLDCFLGTDLDLLLRNLRIKSVCLMGINTNTCVLNTAFTAHNLNYRTVVLADCVASMYGDDLHELGLQNIQRCLGWVVSNEVFKQKISAGYSTPPKT